MHTWFDYRIKKADRISGTYQRKTRAENDPYAVLLSNLSGVGSRPPRQRSAEQQWSKENFDSLVRARFEERWQASGRPNKDHAAVRAEVTKEIFREQTSEVQEAYTLSAKEDHQAELVAWKNKKEGSLSTEPQDRQR